MAATDKVAIFCSYSHKDEDLRSELFQHLRLLKDSGIIQAWYDGEIAAGQQWHHEIEKALRSAEIVLLLVSIDLLTSEFVRERELPIALERCRAGEALIVPVLLRPVSWGMSGLDEFHALPEGLKPVVKWRPRDEAYVAISEGLLEAILSWRKTGPAAVPARSTVDDRVMDVGLPRKAPVNRTTVLAVMVRRPESDGLAGLMDLKQRYGVNPEDVESTESFPVEFPRESNEPVEFGVTIESSDFDCSRRSKALFVPPDEDSDVCVFLLTARRTGSLVVNVELTQGGKRVAGCFLRSEGVTEAVYEPAVQASVGLRPGPAPRRPSGGLFKAAGVIAAGTLLAVVGMSVLTNQRPQHSGPGLSPAAPPPVISVEPKPAGRPQPPKTVQRPPARARDEKAAAGPRPVPSSIRPKCSISGATLSCTSAETGKLNVLIRQNDAVIALLTVSMQAGEPSRTDLRRLLRARGRYEISVEAAGGAVFRRSLQIE